MKNAAEVIQNDLDYICGNLTEELGMIAGRKLLITGGAGFLGYYMVQAVVHWNHNSDRGNAVRLTVLDNYFRGVPEWLVGLEGHEHLRLMKCSIIDPLPDEFEDYDSIIHAAGIASPIYYRMHPIETMDANVHGLRQLLDYCVARKEKGNPVGSFLFFSTSEIYGDPPPESIPTPETYRGNVSCTGPRACYDESKRFGETLCVNFAQVHDLTVSVARPFNNYGPGLKITDGRVLSDFARDVFEGRDIVMKSDGSPRRTFCYAADAVVGYFKVLLRGRSGEAYNIGVESAEISMRELADRVVTIAADRFGYEGKVVSQSSAHTDYLVDNPNRRCPMIDKARSEIGYDPQIGFEEGLERSLVWYSENRHAEDR